MKKFLKSLYLNSAKFRKEIILDFLETDSDAVFLDLGCDDGKWTMEIAKKIGTNSVYGVEIIESRAKTARELGIKVSETDLNDKFPFEDNMFDVIHADQVIEHIAFIDNFMGEIFRVLKPGGYVIMGTENGSSWHNIFASILGWQIFSLTNVSSKTTGLGNPFALNKNEKLCFSSWTHKVIFNYLGFRDIFKVYGFINIIIKGAGYHPLPVKTAKLDVRHAHFIVAKAFKK